MTSEHMACPACHGGEFWLLPDGRIICADDDCYAPFKVGPFTASWHAAGSPVKIIPDDDASTSASG